MGDFASALVVRDRRTIPTAPNPRSSATSTTSAETSAFRGPPNRVTSRTAITSRDEDRDSRRVTVLLLRVSNGPMTHRVTTVTDVASAVRNSERSRFDAAGGLHRDVPAVPVLAAYRGYLRTFAIAVCGSSGR